MRKPSPAAWALAAIVAASVALRTLAGRLHVTPELFPDEYTYAELGRSLAGSGLPLIRGELWHFPALLQPLLTAPAWLADDVAVSYRAVQAIGAVAMSLAAVPAYLLARRLGLGPRLGLAVAGISLLLPDLVYASFVTSEPVAYPLVLAAVLAATAALAQPSRRAQLAFVAFAGLAAFARVQFAVLPLVFLGATVAAGLRERRLRAALREQLLPLGLFALVPLALAGIGAAQALGPYRGGFGLDLRPLSTLEWAALDAMGLAYASGWIIVPGALLGLALALISPRSRSELAFAAFATLLAAALLLEAGFLQAAIEGADVIQERYVFYLVPLAVLGFALYASRGWPLRIPHLLLAAALVVVSVRLPLSGFSTAGTVSGSPLLTAVLWLQGELGETATPSLAVAVAAAALSAIAVGASRRPQLGTPLVIALTVGACAAASAGAVAFTARNTAAIRDTYLGREPSWVDRSGLRHVALLQGWGALKTDAFVQLFWNRSIDRVLLLPGAQRLDAFHSERVRVGDDGSLAVGGVPLAGPILADGHGSTIRLRGARRVGSGPTHALWLPAGRPRLALYAEGRYYDGWLAPAGGVSLWPAAQGAWLEGWLSLTVVSPRTAGPSTLRVQPPDTPAVAVRLRPGVPRRLRFRVCSGGPWQAGYRSSRAGLVGSRIVSVRATEPVFRADPDACRVRVIPLPA